MDDFGRHMLLDANLINGTAYHVYVSSNAQWSQARYIRAFRTRADRMGALVRASLAAFLFHPRAAAGRLGCALDQLVARGSIAEQRLGASRLRR